MPSARRLTMAIAAACTALTLLAPAAAGGADAVGDAPATGSLASAFRSTTRSTTWTTTTTIPLAFDSFHPQGLARVGDRLFLSSVEILEPTERFPTPLDGYDRTPGKGVGHLFVLDLDGNLLDDLVLGEGDVYHPGGIDTDGTSVWVPVAEYRPNSSAIVYKVDAETLEVHEEFRVADHIGGVVPDPTTGLVHGVSWGSRRLYTWTASGAELGRQANSSHFVDYQDCQYAAVSQMLCGGVASIATADGGSVELGGLALVDLVDGRVVHEVPVPGFSTAGHSLTRNPVLVESDDDTLRLWVAPDDGEDTGGTELILLETTLS